MELKDMIESVRVDVSPIMAASVRMMIRHENTGDIATALVDQMTDFLIESWTDKAKKYSVTLGHHEMAVLATLYVLGWETSIEIAKIDAAKPEIPLPKE